MSTDHTRANYRRHWYPEIISRDNYDAWKEKGISIDQICNQKASEILDSHQPPPLASGIEAELERIMRQFVPDFAFED